eukprot:jgi/Astpho2/2549/Aster-x1084
MPGQDSLADLQQWAASSGSRGVAALAGGLNPANIHSSGQPDGVQQSEADDVAAFMRRVSVGGPLLVISASQLLGPRFRLQRIVQHALVRGLDCVCYTAHMPRPETAEGTPQAVMSLEMLQSAEQQQDMGAGACYNAAVYLLFPDTLRSLGSAAGQSIVQLLQDRVDAGAPVYGLPVECCFSVHGLQQLLFTDAFWSYAQQQLRRPAGMGRLAQAALSGTVPGTQPLQTMIRATYQPPHKRQPWEMARITPSPPPSPVPTGPKVQFGATRAMLEDFLRAGNTQLAMLRALDSYAMSSHLADSCSQHDHAEGIGQESCPEQPRHQPQRCRQAD